MNVDIASKQWASRPADERFATLADLRSYLLQRQAHTREVVRSLDTIKAIGLPDGDVKLLGSRGEAALTHHSFNQLSLMASLNGDTLRSAIDNFVSPEKAAKWVADGLNMGLEGRIHEVRTSDSRKSLEANMLMQLPNGRPLTARSFNTAKYSRIWDLDIIDRFALKLWQEGFTNPPAYDGPAGLYASDRDLFILAAPKNVARINMPGIRPSTDSSLGGFEIAGQQFYPFIIVTNSEVGGQSASFFGGLLQEICGNHILWNVRDAVRFSVKHVGEANQRLERGFLEFMAQWTSTGTLAERRALQAAIEHFVAKDGKGTVEWLNDKGWSRKAAQQAVDLIETGDRQAGIHDENPTRLFNVVAALTAGARDIKHQDSRILVEQKAGKLLSLAARN